MATFPLPAEITFAHRTERHLTDLGTQQNHHMNRLSIALLALATMSLGSGCQETGKDCLTGNWLSENENCNNSKRIVFNADGSGTYEYNACDSLCPTDATMWYALRNFTYTADEELVFIDYTADTVYSCNNIMLPMIDTVNTVYLCTGDNLTVGSVNYTRE
jgi:hypothetical protein